MNPPLCELTVEQAVVRVYPSKLEASRAAALEGAHLLRRAIAEQGYARIIMAAANSQKDMVAALVELPNVAWNLVDVFHLDEYVGIPNTHPASFRLWVRTHLVDIVHPRRVFYLNGDAPDLDAECHRYRELIQSETPDICFMGIGENGHIAFNDPHVANFNDLHTVKRVELDELCRQQQTGEGHFPSLNAVPREALTLSCPALMSSKYLVCCVPDRRKAKAVRNALEGPLSPMCPASLVRTHPQSMIFLDLESASLLSLENRAPTLNSSR